MAEHGRSSGTDWLRLHLDNLRAGTEPDPPPLHLGARAMAQDNHDVARTIGALEATVSELRGTVSDLRGTVQDLLSTWRIQEREAIKDRQQLRESVVRKMEETSCQIEEKVNHIRDEIARLKDEVSPLTHTVGEMVPHVEDYRRNKQRIIGGYIVFATLGGGAVALVAWVVALLVHAK